MTQKISPFLEGKYGWELGESGWNTGMDENLLKFSYLFDGNVDGIVDALPTSVVNGTSYFLTSDKRLYFAVGTRWYSSPTPKWFVVKIKSTGAMWRYDGTTVSPIPSSEDLDSRIDSIELTLSSLGSAAFKDETFFATTASLDIASAQANSYTDTLRQDLQADGGSSLVGLSRLNSLSGRTVEDFAREKVSINDFYIPGQVDWTDALQAARDYLAGFPGKPPVLEFESGVVYEYVTSPNWAVPNAIIKGNNATLRCTGTGDCVILDAGTTATIFNIDFGPFFVEGGTTSGDGVYVRSVHHSRISVNVRGCGAVGVNCEFMVCNELRIIVSINEGSWYSSARPTKGVVLNRRGVGEGVTACTLLNPIIEGVQGIGIHLIDADQCTFLGGTSEGNSGANIDVEFASQHNIFKSIDLEVSGSGQGFIDRGRWNTWEDIYNDSLCTVTSTAIGTKIVRGVVQDISLSGTRARLDGVVYGLNGGNLTDSGTLTTWRGIYRHSSGTYLADKINEFQINTGAVVKRHLSTVVGASSWPAGASVPYAITKSGLSIPGAQLGDTVIVGFNPPLPTNYTYTAQVTAVDTVRVDIYQILGTPTSPFASSTMRIDVWGH